ncbi:MAG: DNA-directed RNA polymerase subunit alpha [Planctomycetota bacterium]|nr:DNA-directed RNA polymerase subunit alpha [Planctomycetota bacterium]
MHIRWRGLELPARVVPDTRSLTGTFGRFTAEPFERGYGTTIGNGLRRILLSSIEGAAVTKVEITGVTHEFATIPGIAEDVVDLLLNVKGLIIQMDGEEPMRVQVSVEGPGEVTGAHVECGAGVTILNPQHVICRITGAVKFSATMTIEKGRGYRPASEHYTSTNEQVLGEIPVDAVFSPVQRVRYRVENTRVGQKTNYDRLVMDIWTNGTINPEMALVEAATLLRKHLDAFVKYSEVGTDRAIGGIAEEDAQDARRESILNMSIEDLQLSVRSSNCLQSAGIETIKQLISMKEEDLLGLRAFGKTSLKEIDEKMQELGLTLGMSADAMNQS